jgi:sugar phosphate isomerase/epimerase
VTLGYGHGEAWWREFCFGLKLAGYDDVLSIEHEDLLLAPEEGVRRSVEMLRKVMV